VWRSLPLGAFVVEVGAQVFAVGSYRKPVLLPEAPPQTTMWLPVQIAVCKYITFGGFEVGVQVSVTGSYRPPWLPPQITMRLPVQIAVCEDIPAARSWSRSASRCP
jgi:hypothetical protein